MSRRKFTKADFAAMNKLVAGVRYPPEQGRPQLTTAQEPVPKRKGRRSR
jgi:hypothetical protein